MLNETLTIEIPPPADGACFLRITATSRAGCPVCKGSGVIIPTSPDGYFVVGGPVYCRCVTFEVASDA